MRYITDKALLNSRRIAFASIRRGENVKQCRRLIERLDIEIQRRQPIIYPGLNNEDVLRSDGSELSLDIEVRTNPTRGV